MSTDEMLRLHVEDHARIDALLAERDRARDVAVKLEQEVDHLGARLLLNAIFPENQPPNKGAPRWDEDPAVLRFGWLADRCGRCGEELKAETVAAERERDEALAALARVRALAEKWRYKGEFGWGAWQEGHGPRPGGLGAGSSVQRPPRRAGSQQGPRRPEGRVMTALTEAEAAAYVKALYAEALCGEVAACGYDAEGRPMIHADDGEDET